MLSDLLVCRMGGMARAKNGDRQNAGKAHRVAMAVLKKRITWPWVGRALVAGERLFWASLGWPRWAPLARCTIDYAGWVFCMEVIKPPKHSQDAPPPAPPIGCTPSALGRVEGAIERDAREAAQQGLQNLESASDGERGAQWERELNS